MATLHSPKQASLTFVEDSAIFDQEKPYEIVGDLEPDYEHIRSNLSFTSHQCHVRDLRQDGDEAIDSRFFQIKQGQLDLQDENDVLLSDEVCAENIAAFLRMEFGAELAVVYAIRHRRSDPEVDKWKPVDGSGQAAVSGTSRQPDRPVFRSHVDHTREGGYRRARKHLTAEETKKYLDNPSEWRARIVNLWKPLNRSVKDAPLAFCDPRTCAQTDLLAVERPSTDYLGEVYFVKHNPNQKWYWLDEQKPEEMFIFISWDPDAPEGLITGVPHTAFDLGDSSALRREARESIEARVIIIEPREEKKEMNNGLPQ